MNQVAGNVGNTNGRSGVAILVSAFCGDSTEGLNWRNPRWDPLSEMSVPAESGLARASPAGCPPHSRSSSGLDTHTVTTPVHYNSPLANTRNGFIPPARPSTTLVSTDRSADRGAEPRWLPSPGRQSQKVK